MATAAAAVEAAVEAAEEEEEEGKETVCLYLRVAAEVGSIIIFEMKGEHEIFSSASILASIFTFFYSLSLLRPLSFFPSLHLSARSSFQLTVSSIAVKRDHLAPPIVKLARQSSHETSSPARSTSRELRINYNYTGREDFKTT